MGAAAFTAVGVENFPSSAEKVIAGIVTGIGFLGAGLMMRGEGQHMHGLTTAASMWATAAVGIFAGTGELLLVLLTAGILLLLLELEHLPGVGILLDAGHWRKRAAVNRDSKAAPGSVGPDQPGSP